MQAERERDREKERDGVGGEGEKRAHAGGRRSKRAREGELALFKLDVINSTNTDLRPTRFAKRLEGHCKRMSVNKLASIRIEPAQLGFILATLHV